MARIGEAAAHFLEVTLQQDEIIGVSSWSQTILRMVDNIHPLKSAKAKYVVQILGGMGDASVQTHATQLTARLAKLTGGEPRLLLVQGITSSREAKLVMLADPVGARDDGPVRPHHARHRRHRRGRAVRTAGPLRQRLFRRRRWRCCTRPARSARSRLRFYDSDGKPVETPLNERVIGISLEDLRKADRVMALAGGQSKTQAIAGALKLGVIDVLVTDKFTAATVAAAGEPFASTFGADACADHGENWRSP